MNYRVQRINGVVEAESSPDQGRDDLPEITGDNQPNFLRNKTRGLLMATLIVGLSEAISSPAMAQEKSVEGPDMHGSIGAGVQYLSTTYRKGNSLNLRLKGPELGPVKIGGSACVGGMGTNGLLPSLELGAGISLPFVKGKDGESSYLALNSSLGLGSQVMIAQLDYPQATDVQIWPYANASISLPMTLPLNRGNKVYWMLAPSISRTEYLRADDMRIRWPDGEGGVKEITSPRQNLVLGASSGVVFGQEGTYLGASLNYDPLDPTVKDGVRAVWGSLNLSKSF